MYWLSDKDAQIVCGCWRGSLKDFELRVKRVYDKGSVYFNEYMRFIKVCKYVIKNN